MMTQFICGVIALASGQSGGREGPAIHLRAAGSSLLGQWLKLPNNSIRILVGCGVSDTDHADGVWQRTRIQRTCTGAVFIL